VLSYFGQFALDPLCVALVLLALAYALRRRWPRVAFWLPAAAGLLLWFFALPATANGLMHALEAPVTPVMKDGDTYDAVIMLTGSVEPATTADTGEPQYNDTVERVLTTFDLLRTNRARFAILSGTSWGQGRYGLPSESRIIASQLAAWGIDASRIVTDDVSRNTHQNAIESVRIAREHAWLHDVLVTSAAHMKRAHACFAKLGLDPDTRATDFAAYEPAKHGHGWQPRAVILDESVSALHEYVGRFVYRLRGWTD
jgi:uncharacterized SAM-binding protein YcdF (DUF218 family)